MWVLKQWMPQVMWNSGHLLETESPENLVSQLTEHIMEEIFSYTLWQSISVSHIRQRWYPGRSNGRYDVAGMYISISGKGKGTVLESLGLWKVCTQVLLQSIPYPASKLNVAKPPKGNLWGRKRGACIAYTQGLKARRSRQPRALCSLWTGKCGLEPGQKPLSKTCGVPPMPGCWLGCWHLRRPRSQQGFHGF